MSNIESYKEPTEEETMCFLVWLTEPMDELKAQIKLESNRASRLSQEAVSAFSEKQFEQGKLLMKEAVIASKECQKLIQQYTQIDNLQTSEKIRITDN